MAVVEYTYGLWSRMIRANSLLLFCTLIPLSIDALSAQRAPIPEYQIKAVFLYNFAQFIDWPSVAFEESQSPFVIGILGEDPFGTYLDETLANEKVNSHPMLVKRFQRIEDIKACHILFISHPKKENFKAISHDLRSRNILTVSDAEDFISEGGIIKFLQKNGKIKIGINLEGAKATNLVISSKLLRLAEIVTP